MAHKSVPSSCQQSDSEPLNLPVDFAKTALIDSFLLRGEYALLHDDTTGIDLFEKAAQLDPNNPTLFFREGLALYDYGLNAGKERNLFIASKKLKKAITLDPNNAKAWHAWGNTLNALGEIYEESHYFSEAEDKIKQAISLIVGEPQSEHAELFWDLANVWKNIGDYSGEAYDLRVSINAYEKCYLLEKELPCDFWLDYGDVYLLLASLINDPTLYPKAIHAFRTSIALEKSSSDGWFNLAEAFSGLYTHSHEEDHFSQACDCYAKAINLAPNDGLVYYKWAQTLLDAGKNNKDLRRLRCAIEKCHKAHDLNYERPFVMAMWAEALAWIGLISDRYELLSEAESKIEEASNLCPEAPEIWLAYGKCLNIIGTYFEEIDIHYQAIEKFQEGLSIDRSQHELWHAMAVTYSTISQIDLDQDAFEKSLRFFYKSLNFKITSYRLFDLAMALAQFGEITSNQSYLEEALERFEQALALQKNALYQHPDWLFYYGSTLDLVGDNHDTDTYYLKAIDIFSHLLLIDPDYPSLHHRLALAYSHIGELSSECCHFYKALHHFRIASKRDEENDQIILDSAITYINFAQHLFDREEANQILREAELKMMQAAKLGNVNAYYHLACLHSLLKNYDKAVSFILKADSFEALPPLDEIQEDEWLDNLRTFPSFQQFLQQLESRSIS
jgi:tetratricopeptide (TPR) repeat protein